MAANERLHGLPQGADPRFQPVGRSSPRGSHGGTGPEKHRTAFYHAIPSVVAGNPCAMADKIELWFPYKTFYRPDPDVIGKDFFV